MAALDILNNTAELDLTPSRKRKRHFDKCEIQEQQNAIKTTAAATSCFTNEAFSSTPKKNLGKRRLQLKINKENALVYPNVGLEVKSIAELARRPEEAENIPRNPYEVLRKPPKKKKRQAEGTACFENPALNLELPEKQFNPYEVVREITPNKASNCFSNPALNLKIQDASAIHNPFEVHRELPDQDIKSLNPFEFSSKNEHEQRLSTPKPCKLKLGLPFVPTVGCRIDFKDISMSQLTPSKLLAEKLVFSPVPKAKVSLGSIGEETTMDIGKELDRYQLELENSINEAKLRKNGVAEEELLLSPPDTNYQIQIVDTEKKSKFTQKLSGISEDGETEEIIEETNTKTEHHIEVNVVVQKEEQKFTEVKETNPFLYDLSQQFQRTETAEVIEIENLDDLYGCSEEDQEDAEDSFDFKTPAPFVRAYTKPAEPKLTVSRESLETNKSEKSDKSGDADDNNKKTMNVKNIIRKSIRKLMHPNGQQPKETEKDLDEKIEHEKHGLMNAIRHSLRRKPTKNVQDEEPVTKECEISIIDGTERTMKLKSEALETEYLKIEDLTNEKKHNLRNSIRKSTREVRNHLMKSVFHKKHEEYDFNK
ncbi:uncharacterized protein LOC111677134 [Lucilia cuprina]|uniref:uncharacterized protein LOC111677134 n=1 Tax=Lucilia cuprina TaxID=7375 RepID=UPI001F06403C|nr:uncharacterized protein LOC111677134 [Lucilia cuprina]